MPTFFLYARKSTEEDDRQIASIGAQVAELQDLARARGLVVARVFEESQSARKTGRPVFAEMMREADRHRVAGILCWKPDRLARNMVDGGRVIDALDRGVVGEIVSPGRLFRNTADDKLLLGLEFSMSKKYVDDLSDNVKRGNRSVLASGRVPGAVPIGYLKEPPLDRTHGRGAGRTIPDPERFPLVAELFRRFATGSYTASEIHRVAGRELGLRTRGTRTRPSAPLSLSTVYQMLSNPFYMGLIRFGADVFPGDHRAVVSKEDFDQIQLLLRRANRHRPSCHTFTYRGLLGCQCGRGVTAETHTKTTGLTFTYYRCSRRRKEPSLCSKPYLSELELESRIYEAFSALVVPDRFLRWGLRRIDALAVRSGAVTRAAREALNKELVGKERELERLTTLCLRGALSEDEFVATKTRLLGEKVELVARLADPAPEATALQRLREMIIVATEAAKAFREGSPDERRVLVADHCEKLTLHGDGLDIEFARPFAILAGRASTTDIVAEGANPSPTQRNLNGAGRKRTITSAPVRSSRRVRCPAGANSINALESPLNQSKNRAVADAKPARFSTWWTRVNEVRTLLTLLGPVAGSDQPGRDPIVDRDQGLALPSDGSCRRGCTRPQPPL